jgi:hypothetical protein
MRYSTDTLSRPSSACAEKFRICLTFKLRRQPSSVSLSIGVFNHQDG